MRSCILGAGGEIMKRVILEIDDNFDNILSVTAIGLGLNGANVSTYAADLKSCERIIIDSTGKCTIIEKEM